MLALAPGWRAQLSVRLGPRGDRTRVRALSHQGPLRVQRLFHPEPDGTAHVYVLHPPGGVVAGDELAIDAHVEPHGLALLTTPGATKIYRSERASAQVRSSLHVASGATLEHLPQETIVFDGARARIATRLVLEDGARYLGWEITCLGRPACGERFTHGALRLGLEIVDGAGRPRVIERGAIEGGGRLSQERWGLAGHAAIGTLVATDGDLDAVRTTLASRGWPASATRIAGLVVCRALAHDAAEIRAAFEEIRHHVRARWGRAPIDPAVWRT